jgi:hypothetical protein
VSGLWRGLLAGAAAGAAGTTALNAATYVDMAVRGRPTSSTPEETVAKVASLTRVPIPGDDADRENRIQGLGPLTGILTGVGVGAVLGGTRALGLRPAPIADTITATMGALVTANGPMTLLGLTDPRSWAPADWLADLIPHVAYGIVTAAVLERLDTA